MTTATIARPAVDDRFLCDLFDGVAGSYAVGIAHDLGIFRLLHEKPRTAGELSRALGGGRDARPPAAIEPRRLEILLNLCVAAKLAQLESGRYGLTDVAETYLVESSPTYAGALFELWSGDDPPFSFKKLREGVLCDSRHAPGQRPWIDHHRDDGDAARSFTRIMHGHSMAPALAWPDHVDLARHRCMLDVGGGSGAHALAAAMRWPRLEAIILDLPPVCVVADEYIARYGLRDRVRAHAADMWRDPHPDADVHFYSDVFHNWTPDEGASLARKSFASLPESGCIILHEMLYDDDKRGPFTVAASSMAMLTWCGGQQFSGPELVALLRDAGFRETRVTPTFGYWSVVVGTKR